MVYLDYSATTKTNNEVLNTFIKVSNEFYGNPNSLHSLIQFSLFEITL